MIKEQETKQMKILVIVRTFVLGDDSFIGEYLAALIARVEKMLPTITEIAILM